MAEFLAAIILTVTYTAFGVAIAKFAVFLYAVL